MANKNTQNYTIDKKYGFLQRTSQLLLSFN